MVLVSEKGFLTWNENKFIISKRLVEEEVPEGGTRISPIGNDTEAYFSIWVHEDDIDVIRELALVGSAYDEFYDKQGDNYRIGIRGTLGDVIETAKKILELFPKLEVIEIHSDEKPYEKIAHVVLVRK